MHTARIIARALCATLFVSSGVLHFVTPDPFVLIVPPYLPAPEVLVQVSGAFEILGGVGLLIPRVRVAAGWGLVALLIAIFPANLHMAVNEVYLPDMPQERWLLWVRLPVQLVFAAMVVFGAGIRLRSAPSADDVAAEQGL